MKIASSTLKTINEVIKKIIPLEALKNKITLTLKKANCRQSFIDKTINDIIKKYNLDNK